MCDRETYAAVSLEDRRINDKRETSKQIREKWHWFLLILCRQYTHISF